MRILVVSTWYPDRDAPFRTPFVPRHVAAIARDHEVHVVHIRLLDHGAPCEESWDGVGVTRVGLDPRHPMSVLRTLGVLRTWASHADVVHTMALSSALVAAPLAWSRPWVHTEHWNGVIFPEHVHPVWERVAWLRHVLRLPDAVTGVSSLMTSTLERFARPGTVQRIGNVVEHSELVPPKTAQPFALMAVGAATEHKGAELAVETVAWLRDRGHDASLVWAGDGPRRAAALERAAELGVADHVSFPGFRSPEQLWQHFAESSVFVLPSRSETFCVAAAEALAAGRPVVMGDQGGQRDFIRPSNGRMVPTRSAEAFGSAVVDLVSDPGTEPPQALADTIRREYGRDAVADQLTGLYQEVTDGTVGRRRNSRRVRGR